MRNGILMLKATFVFLHSMFYIAVQYLIRPRVFQSEYQLLSRRLIALHAERVRSLNEDYNDVGGRRFARPGAALAYLRDFCTLRLDLGQRMGTTILILRMAQPEDIIVVVHDSCRKHQYGHARCRVMTIGEVIDEYRRGNKSRPHPRIWVDTANWTLAKGEGPDSTEVLYDYFGSTLFDQTFVLLG